MIFVTVGSHYQGFERLIKKVDEIAGRVDEKVIMQIGYTKYSPHNAEYFCFEDYKKMKELNHKARVVVSHAGVGSILTALEQKTPMIIVPRLKRFGEVIDDHQLEIAVALSSDPRIRVIYDIDNLNESALINLYCIKVSEKNSLVNIIKSYLVTIH